MKVWQPYKLGVLLAEYARPHCQLCSFRPSIRIDNDATRGFKQGALIKSTSFLGPLNLGVLCQECHANIHWLPKSKQIELILNNQATQTISIQPATYYQHPINKVIRRFKFSEDMKMLPILIHAIRQLPQPNGCYPHNSVILPVPTTRERLKKRGFNPLSIITPYLSEHWNIPIWQGVERIDDTVSQRRLSREERQANIKGAFVVTDSIPVDNILIFDDVATTGSTIKEIATILRLASKNSQIKAYCIAHGSVIFT